VVSRLPRDTITTVSRRCGQCRAGLSNPIARSGLRYGLDPLHGPINFSKHAEIALVLATNVKLKGPPVWTLPGAITRSHDLGPLIGPTVYLEVLAP
jgi:hypothetical protein